jgi:hypothetical protein
MESTASIRTLLLAFTKVKPLEGLVTPRFENSGMEEPELDPPPVPGTVM